MNEPKFTTGACYICLTETGLFVELKLMSSKLLRITLNSNQPEILVQFYALLGFEFTRKQVDKGSLNWVGLLGDMQLDIFGIEETFTSRSPTVQFSFEVRNIQQIVDKVRELGTQVMMEPLETKTGILCFLVDPDGRSVELTQKN